MNKSRLGLGDLYVEALRGGQDPLPGQVPLCAALVKTRKAIGEEAGDTVTVCLQERLGGPARHA